jgi:hypothetical protein
MTRGVVALIVVAAALIAVPLFVTNDFYLNLASQILIYAPRSSGSPAIRPC